jgi:hypothetical protein
LPKTKSHLPPRLAFGRAGTSSLKLSCSARTCTGKVALTLIVDGVTATLTTQRFTLSDRHKRAVTLRLTRRTQTALAKRLGKGTTATLTITTGSGQKLVETVRLAVARPRGAR